MNFFHNYADTTNNWYPGRNCGHEFLLAQITFELAINGIKTNI